MSTHGNSLKNENPHHLYEIRDIVENDLFKYGISDDPIERNGLSKRMRNQIDFLNRAVGSSRFVGNILLKNIPGRASAKELEDEFIDRYFDEYGKKPKGNPVGGTRK
ncbi:MAG TPA: hypothetical protein PK228_09030 [Saprospiraceae bacterium]|nr:hypothetical protein [Saprospiraceae bacterium]